MRSWKYLFGLLPFLLIFFGCQKDQKQPVASTTLFQSLDSIRTGISFTNHVVNTRDFNIFNYRNFYNGGGVAIGDINNDGLADIFLTSNLEKNRLFLNVGDFSFKDISGSSGTEGERAWSTGVVMVDLNADGLLDIYVCNAGNIGNDNQKNELFINNGDLTFTEKAEEFNLADDGFTTHASFFDYDQDGDLDVYILNNSFIPVNSLDYSNKRDLRAKDWDIPSVLKGGGDKLLRNDDGHFVDVSEAAGIFGSLIGFGLGVTVADINDDLYPDIYISNDFYERDYLYINNQDGTFTEALEKYLSHLSFFSMGADIGDINNDGKPDIFVTDMLPEGDERTKNTTSFDGYDFYNRKIKLDFYNQYMHNTLQLNTGVGSFKDVAFYSNVARSDWSWGALLLDLDNDGYRDIYVCNGIYHDLINQDFMNFMASELIQKKALKGTQAEIDTIVNKMPSTPIPNCAFRNNGDLTFTNEADAWGLATPGFSNGAAYGDLDNDGDLDLVVNNVNQPLFVYRNNSREQGANHFIKLKLKGSGKNTFGVGSIIEVYPAEGTMIRQEVMPARGFQSSVDYDQTIGIGKAREIDSIRILWPDRKFEIMTNPGIDTTLVFRQNEATGPIEKRSTPTQKSLFHEINNTIRAHSENNYIDFDYERLIYKMLSREGPATAAGDLDQDGNEDLFIGGAKGQAGAIYMHQGNGKVVRKAEPALEADAGFEDTGATFFDADQDGDLDLLVGSGGNEREAVGILKNRLYLNDGHGNFQPGQSLPTTGDNVSVIIPEDYDQDGDIDVFIGSRSVPGEYGIDPKHLLLENDGKGHFTNIIERRAFEVSRAGMITDAIWKDMDGDSLTDLIVTVDWGAPRIFKNDGKRLNALPSTLDSLDGWWNAVAVADLDNDGDEDLILGNQGTNTPYRASPQAPMKMYLNDFDDNGGIEQIMTQQINGRDKPVMLRNDLMAQLPGLKKQNLRYASYATKSVQDLFGEERIHRSLVKQVVTGESVQALNEGNGHFSVSPLPPEAQFSCICSITCGDYNRNGANDVLYGGNAFDFKPQFSRQDASFGGFLSGGKNGLMWEDYPASGFMVDGEIKDILPFKDKDDHLFFLIARNNDTPKIFALNAP